jgi:acetylglutamate kinase
MRVTDAETMEVVEWVLAGEVQQDIVGLINQAGGKAVGLTGRDGGLMRAKKLRLVDQKDPSKEHDLGQVGDIESIDPSVVRALQDDQFIPVVSPIGFGAANESYNINADVVAAKLATVLQAEKLLMLTNIPGVLDKQGQLLTELTMRRIDELVADGTISGGMIPKIAGRAGRRSQRGTCGAHHRRARAACDAAGDPDRPGLRHDDPKSLSRRGRSMSVAPQSKKGRHRERSAAIQKLVMASEASPFIPRLHGWPRRLRLLAMTRCFVHASEARHSTPARQATCLSTNPDRGTVRESFPPSCQTHHVRLRSPVPLPKTRRPPMLQFRRANDPSRASGASRSCRRWQAMLEQPGGERITTAALAARLGVSEAALYRHFASKAQMFEGLIEFIEQAVFALVSQITTASPNDGRQKVAAHRGHAASVWREESRNGARDGGRRPRVRERAAAAAHEPVLRQDRGDTAPDASRDARPPAGRSRPPRMRRSWRPC